MIWFYFMDEVTCTQVRWDNNEERVRIIDPVLGVVCNETGINLVRVLKQVRYYLNRKNEVE